MLILGTSHASYGDPRDLGRWMVRYAAGVLDSHTLPPLVPSSTAENLKLAGLSPCI